MKEGEQYRRTLQREELLVLGRLYRDFRNWQQVHAIIRKTYGEKAAVAVVEEYAQYDDEDGYYALTDLKDAYDKDGNVLSTHLDLPYWQSMYRELRRGASAHDFEDEGDEGVEYDENGQRSYLGSRFSSLKDWFAAYQCMDDDRWEVNNLLYKAGVALPLVTT